MDNADTVNVNADTVKDQNNDNAPTIGAVIKEKVNNFILYCEKSVGKDNKLYPQLLQLRDEKAIVSYSKYIFPIAKKVNDRYEVDVGDVRKYLISNGFNDEMLKIADGGNFVNKVARYMGFFITMMYSNCV